MGAGDIVKRIKSDVAAGADSMSMDQHGSYREASEKFNIAGPEAAARLEEWRRTYAEIRGKKEKEKDFLFSGSGSWHVFSGGRAGEIAQQVCMPNIGQASGQKLAQTLAGLCNIDPVIRFTESRYATLNPQLRVFIEGAEVTPWLEGSVSWSYQSTGGQGTCSFTLNNNNDAFTITPQNICAGVNPAGWRIYRGDKSSVLAETAPITWNHDESAKYIIYKKKYQRVNPEGGAKAKIDKDGIWLYPLEPMTPVFNKHDCVRVFCRLAHVAGATTTFTDKDGKVIVTKELWVPAWTGFIDQHSTNDDLVTGHRTISVQCYDFRGILAKMRVRVDHNPQPGGKGDPEGKVANSVLAALNTVMCGGVTQAQYIALLKKYGAAGFLNETFLTLYDAAIKLQKDPARAGQIKTFNARLANILNQVAYDTNMITQVDKAFNKLVENVVCGLKAVDKALTEANGNTAVGGVWTVVYKADGTFKPEVNKGGRGDAKTNTALLEQLRKDTNGIISTFCLTATNNDSTLPWKSAWDTYADSWAALARKAKQSGGWGNVSNTDTSITAKLLTDLVTAITAWISSSGIGGSAYNTITVGAITTDGLLRMLGGSKSGTTWTLNNPSSYSSTYENKYLSFIANLIASYVGNIGSKMTAGARGAVANAFKAAAAGSFASSGGTNVSIAKNLAKVTDIWSASALFKYGLRDGQTTRLQIFNTITQATLTTVEASSAALANLPGKLKAETDAMSITTRKLNAANAQLAALAAVANSGDMRASASNADKVKQTVLRQRDNALGGNDPNKDKSSLADLITKDVSYKEEDAGMFADIVRSSGQDAHPLAGLPFELAVEWLCLKNTKVCKGFRVNVGTYGDGTLANWNKTALFGVYGRPLTYQEVTIMGRGTVMETEKKDGAFSPIQPFLHILLPKDGTGAMTIVQQQIGANTSGSMQFRYETRLAMLNEICELLDYQFYVSPVGDLVFEFPHYNAIPSDFGKVFQGAYTVAKEVQTSKIGHETGPMYSAWILQGMEVDAGLDPVASTHTGNQMKKEIIVLGNVARRLGANPRYLNLRVPGVGANVQMDARGGLGTAKQQLLAYAYLAIQRDIGKSETVSVDHPYRPYLLPNRPYWLVHRQRIGLVSSVDYSVQVHKGDATARAELGYIRKLYRDGTYRNAAGGWRSPVDYSGINAGSVPTIMKFGAGNSKGPTSGGGVQEQAALAKLWAEQNHGNTAPSAGAPSKCGPALKNAWIMAGANYDDAAAGLSGSAASLRIQRDDLWAPNPGDKFEAVDERGSGYTSQEPPKKTTPFTGFKNPFTFGISSQRVAGGVKAGIGMDNFGFIGRGGDDPYHVSQSMHPGIDIPANPGKTHHVLAPITLQNITTYIRPFNGSKSSVKALEKSEWQKQYDAKPVVAQLSARPFLSPKGAKKAGTKEDIFYIDTQQYAIKKENPEVEVMPTFGPEGLAISGTGWVAMPDDSSGGQVFCKLTYMHLKTMVYPSGVQPPTSGLGGGLSLVKLLALGKLRGFYGGALKTCQAGTKMAVVGESGNAIAGSPHLHLNMSITYKNWQGKAISDLRAFEAARKATLDYLRATLLARITGGLGGGATVESGKVSDAWRARMKAKGPVSMAAALAFAENIVADKLKEYFQPVDDWKGISWIPVNPYLFFSPDQLVTPLPREYTESIKDKDYLVDATQICGASQGGFAQQLAREERKCLADVVKMKQSKAKDTALLRCRAIKKSNAELLALKVNNPDASSEALARLLAEKLNKPGAGAAAPAK